MSGDRREPMWRRYRRFLRSDIAADVDEELEFHLEMRARHYEARGLPPEAAHRAARERFGDMGRVARWLRRHDQSQERARRIYVKARAGYHPIAQATIDGIVLNR